MNRRLTVLFAAAEALLVVAVGLAIPLLMLTVLWAVQFGFGPDWTIFARGAVDLWLLGHGVDVTFTLDPLLAASLGMPGSASPVTVTIAVLGFALLTALLGARAGRRIAESGRLVLGQLVAVLLVAALSLGLALLVSHPAAQPSRWQAAVLPAAVFAIGLLLGVRRARDVKGDRTGRIRELVERIPVHARDALGSAVRTGFAAAAALLVIASLVTATAIAVRYAQIIALYESLHTEVLGGVAITLGQIAFLPDFIVWTASWLVGTRVRHRHRVQREPARHQPGAGAGDPHPRRAARRRPGVRLRGPGRPGCRRIPGGGDLRARDAPGRPPGGMAVPGRARHRGGRRGHDRAARVGGERIRRARASRAGRARSGGGRSARRAGVHDRCVCRDRSLRTGEKARPGAPIGWLAC